MDDGLEAGAQAPAAGFPATKYACPKCDNRVEVFVTLVEPPVCWSGHDSTDMVQEA